MKNKTNKILFLLFGVVYLLIQSYLYYLQDILKKFYKTKQINNYGNDVKIIAFYLPQFHSIPENDKWWGKDFTEWANTKKAKPLFKNHYQPRVPSDEIGYYNLLEKETQKKQIELAKEHGIYGFCFYHYWFNGKKLLEKPVELFLNNRELDFPFCLCWANEPWTRKWDGFENEVLQPQTYGDEDDWLKHFNYLLPAFKDKRAIKINGKPLFLIYRIGHIKDVNIIIQFWNNQAKKNGIEGIYFAAGFGNFDDNRFFTDYNIDAIYEFAPNCITDIPRMPYPLRSFEYDFFWQKLISQKKIYPVQFRGAFVSFDNTARTNNNPRIIFGSNPHKYGIYLKKQVDKVCKEMKKDRIIMLNSWNEWGEACYLEPDKKYGRAFLESTKNAIMG